MAPAKRSRALRYYKLGETPAYYITAWYNLLSGKWEFGKVHATETTVEGVTVELTTNGRHTNYKTLSTATEMMKNTWKRVLKNNQSYLSDPEKQKVLRFSMQRPALYLNELEACMEQILAETLEEAEKTA